jgi:hypothetical protein
MTDLHNIYVKNMIKRGTKSAWSAAVIIVLMGMISHTAAAQQNTFTHTRKSYNAMSEKRNLWTNLARQGCRQQCRRLRTYPPSQGGQYVVLLLRIGSRNT